jgi:hypothetical protein
VNDINNLSNEVADAPHIGAKLIKKFQNKIVFSNKFKYQAAEIVISAA